MASKVNISEKFEQFDELWSPRIVAELNGQHVKLARVHGEFDWHFHEEADELFYVVEGQLLIELRSGSISLSAGELCVIPRGIEHRPVAREEAKIMLFEPAGTLNTGNILSEKTVADPRLL